MNNKILRPDVSINRCTSLSFKIAKNLLLFYYPTTKSRDVAMYLKHVHGKHFKVEQLRNIFPGHASFKGNVTSKDQLQPLLNKNNWDSGVFGFVLERTPS